MGHEPIRWRLGSKIQCRWMVGRGPIVSYASVPPFPVTVSCTGTAVGTGYRCGTGGVLRERNIWYGHFHCQSVGRHEQSEIWPMLPFFDFYQGVLRYIDPPILTSVVNLDRKWQIIDTLGLLQYIGNTQNWRSKHFFFFLLLLYRLYKSGFSKNVRV